MSLLESGVNNSQQPRKVNKCTECGIADPLVLLAAYGWCYNCYQLDVALKASVIRQNDTSTRGKKASNRARQQNEKRVVAEKIKRQACLSCHDEVTTQNLPIFQFHHRKGTEKVAKISAFIKQTYSEELLENELAKCYMICANCMCKRSRTTQ